MIDKELYEEYIYSDELDDVTIQFLDGETEPRTFLS